MKHGPSSLYCSNILNIKLFNYCLQTAPVRVNRGALSNYSHQRSQTCMKPTETNTPGHWNIAVTMATVGRGSKQFLVKCK